MSIASFQESQHIFLQFFQKETLRKRKNNPLEARYLEITVNFQQLKILSSRPGGECDIAYVNVFPIECIYRDIRLASIWTGTSKVMSMITAPEWFHKYFQEKAKGKTSDHELDAPEAYDEEKIYGDDDMWKKGW